MKKIFIIIIIICLAYYISSDENKTLVKRTVSILPFTNINNVAEYDYLKETLRNALKAELMNTKLFKISLFSEIDEELKKVDYKLNEQSAIQISKNVNADVAVIGKFTILNDRISIQIDAVDIFKSDIVASVSITGETGLDMFQIIDDASRLMSDEMSKKLQMVEKTYFEEMKRLIEKERRSKLKERFTVKMKIGISLTAAGGGLILIGLPIFIYDMAAYINVIRDNMYNNPRTEEGYVDYVQATYVGFSLLIGSLVTMGVGLTMLSVGIPFMIIEIRKRKKSKISINFFMNENNSGIAVSYKF